MKGIHILILVCLVVLIGMYSFDEYQTYSNDGQRIKSYEAGEIVRVYIDDQKMIQIVDTTAYHEHMIFTVVIEAGQIVDVSVISHNETVGYGDYIEKDWFQERLLLATDKPLEVVKLSKEKSNEVVAITGATITSRKMVEGVNDCIDNYWRYLDEF
jgi:Na+-translocating ferredoxin:NAD+ oxidoreductase RnfG subunit